MSSEWKFFDRPELAVIAHKDILEGEDWIAVVSHDQDDGSWQFHTSASDSASPQDARVVSLASVFAVDSSIAELFDLPVGWYAWRKNRISEWQRVCTDSA